jgi:hypothetical protein
MSQETLPGGLRPGLRELLEIAKLTGVDVKWTRLRVEISGTVR